MFCEEPCLIDRGGGEIESGDGGSFASPRKLIETNVALEVEQGLSGDRAEPADRQLTRQKAVAKNDLGKAARIATLAINDFASETF